MEVTETLSEGLKREFKITVPATAIDAEVDGRIRELAGTVRLPGFRPGKVPPSLLKKRFGKALMGEVLEKTVGESSQKALEDRGLRPAAQPRIEITAFDDGADLEYTLSLELMPEITPIDFSTLEVERLKAEASDDEIGTGLERLAEQHKSSEPIEEPRPSAPGDVVVIDFKGMVDGVAFEGGSAEDFQLELGSGRFIPGFEDQLIGLDAGAEKNVEVTFPEDYPQADLAGKPAVFETTVKEIREPKPVTIDDDFAKLFGMEDLGALREAVKGQIEGEFVAAAKSRLKREVLDKLEETHDFGVPEGLVDQEYEAICRAVKQERGEGAAHSHDHDHDHDQDHDHDHDHSHDHAHPAVDEGFDDEEKAEYAKIANRRVRLALLLQEVGRLNNITVTDEEMMRAVQMEAQRYPGQEKQVMDFYQQNAEAQNSIRGPMFEDKIISFIVEMASVTDKTVTGEELLAMDRADDDDEDGAEDKKDA